VSCVPAGIRWHETSSDDSLAEGVVSKILDSARDSISATGAFSLVLTGGTSVAPVYERLGAMNAKWNSWKVYWGDERCVGPSHEHRNSKLAFDAWLGRVPIPSSQIHTIDGELGPTQAASKYSRILDGVGHFDLVLLSLGEDGHVASLFPGQSPGSNPKDPPAVPTRAPLSMNITHRVTLSSWRLSKTRRMYVLARGTRKRHAVDSWRAGCDLPAAHMSAVEGLDVWC
jgi:6-phosphogluconolactonase